MTNFKPGMRVQLRRPGTDRRFGKVLWVNASKMVAVEFKDGSIGFYDHRVLKKVPGTAKSA